MTNEKFISEAETLKKFFTIYCKDKHNKQNSYIRNLRYKHKNYEIEFHLCNECKELINYSIERLEECPHEIKPRCRKCPNPCYEKSQWKKLAHLMRYSGIQLGILKIKKFFRL
ncbi:nitrous oxide-stimulated promoter family protein [Arcobacteraceae bacterium]|nr:nitrous oxide-stimulated promoter family protein [Arcobacteraceae bacterium]